MDKHSYVVVFLMTCVVVTGTLNNFLGRIRAVTLGQYDGFVASIVDAMSFFCMSCIGLLVESRVRGPQVRSQMSYMRSAAANLGPWKLLLLAGISDQCGNICGFTAQPYLSTLMYSLMNQAIVPFTVIWSMMFLGTRYTAFEAAAVLVVALGAIGCVLSGTHNGKKNDFVMAVLASTSTAFPAAAFVLKEMVFRGFNDKPAPPDTCTVEFSGTGLDASTTGRVEREPLRSQGGEEPPPSEHLSVFVVSATVGFFQLLVSVPVALATEALSSHGNTWLRMADGFRCLAGHAGPPGTQCGAAPWAYAAYTVGNILFNFSLIVTVGRGSALLAFLSLKIAVATTAVLSPLPWPLIGPNPVAWTQWFLLLVIMLGVAAFRYGNIQREGLHSPPCLWPLRKPRDGVGP